MSQERRASDLSRSRQRQSYRARGCRDCEYTLPQLWLAAFWKLFGPDETRSGVKHGCGGGTQSSVRKRFCCDERFASNDLPVMSQPAEAWLAQLAHGSADPKLLC